MTNRLVLSLGSNCGDREANVRKAADWLGRLLSCIRCSGIYETPEVHEKGSPYMNAVVIGETAENLEAFNAELKQYELRAGRDETCRLMGLVPIDIDIVVCNDEVLRPFDYSSRFFTIGYRHLTLPAL